MTAESTGPERAFWGTDYRRFARIIRDVRREHGDAAADAIATPIVGALSTDNADFDAERFLAGTHVIPSYVGQLAAALKTATHKRCEPWTPASDEKLAKVGALGTALAAELDASVPHFKTETFMESVKPPVRNEATASAGYDEDEDDDED